MIEANRTEEQEVNLSGKRILVVDDDDTVRGLVERIFTRQGSAVFAARSGEEALVRYQEEGSKGGFDLVVTDKDMGGISGIELSRRLIKKGLLAPIILASGGLTEKTRDEARKAGVSAVLEKPFLPSPITVLVSTAKQVLSK